MKPSPTAAAKKHGVKVYGLFWYEAMTPQSRKQLIRAFVAGARYQKRLQRKNGT